ncbi:hypothetical protein T492DRAFT_929713 [Pavlovales sp. CCMP2436]|nr:hypothetical protein T492DRAFT_929713 [Pavlovales sp. CCMP2436]
MRTTTLTIALLVTIALGCSRAAVLRAQRAPALPRHVRRSRVVALARGDDDGEPPADGEDAAGSSYSTDWDADWRRFSQEGSSNWRPEGRAAYTAEELTSARASRVISDLRQSVPTPYELIRDVRFWVSLVAISALAPAIYQVMQAAPRVAEVLV